MKECKAWGSALLKVLLSVSLIVPAVTSCYDDEELWNEIEKINDKLNSLEESLNGQIQTLNDLLAGGDITISECVAQKDGSYSITLSNGTSFNVLPDGKTLNGLVSCKEVNGVKCWAAYNENGVLVPLTDASGDNIPVAAAKPVVEERDGVYYLVIDDVEYVTGHEDATIITSYEVNKDDSGNIYSVSFTFGDEALTFTVPMASYKGLSYLLGNLATGGKVIKDLYVSNGATYQIALKLDGVVDYVLSVPAGWTVEEVKQMEETYLDITAPALSEVEAGAALAKGDLKAVAVLDDKTAMIARLELTTVPFKTITATATNAIIEKHNGVDKFIYGLVAYEDYDEAALFASADALLMANDSGVSENDINIPLADMLEGEIVPGVPYILYAIPAFYDQDDEESNYYVREGVIAKYLFGGSAVNLSVSDITFNDAEVSFDIAGADAYFAGTLLNGETVIDDILYKVNNQILDPVKSPLTYTGSAFTFPSAEANEGVAPVSEQTYITWVIPVNEEGKYTADNLISQLFTLKGVTSGGETVVTVSSPEDAVIDRVSISVQAASESASRLYYVFLKSSEAKRYRNQEEAYLLKNGKVIDAAEAQLKAEELDPDTAYTLFVMSTDREGKYGEATVAEYTTDKLLYNELSVSVVTTTLGKSTAKANVTVTGGEATDYVYWVGHQFDPVWVNAAGTTANDKIAAIQKQIVLYPESMEKMKYNHPLNDGVLSMSNLKGGTLHYVIVCAKDQSNEYSVAGYTSFTTLDVELGTVVKTGTTEWNNAKEQIDIRWSGFSSASASGLFAYYSFSIKCPKNFTSYILCASDEYFEHNPDIVTINDKIIQIEMDCSEKCDDGKVVFGEDGEMLSEPDWVDDDGVTHIGTLMNVYNFYVHGVPSAGYVTYFAEGTHGENNCPTWEDGACSYYNYALEHITKRHTLDYFKEYVATNRVGCKSQETIDRVAKDLYDAYYPYYKDAQPIVYINDGSYLQMSNPYATGLDDQGNVIDDVFVVLKDLQGNYYEPMKFEVPNNFN